AFFGRGAAAGAGRGGGVRRRLRARRLRVRVLRARGRRRRRGGGRARRGRRRGRHRRLDAQFERIAAQLGDAFAKPPPQAGIDPRRQRGEVLLCLAQRGFGRGAAAVAVFGRARDFFEVLLQRFGVGDRDQL